MKKSIIISVAIVIMIAVVCVTAFAFWDTTVSNVSFDAVNAIGQGVKFSVAVGDVAENKTLIPTGAIKSDNEKTEIMIGSAVLKYAAPDASDTVLKSKINTFTPSVKKFLLGNKDITSSWSDIFEIWISTDLNNSSKNKTLMGAANSDDAYVNLTDTKAYAFMKFKKTASELNSTEYAERKFTIDITFTIA